MERQTVNTGIRITPGQAEKLRRLSENLGISRNSVVGFLIESAEPKSRPKVTSKKNSRSARILADHSATAIEAQPS